MSKVHNHVVIEQARQPVNFGFGTLLILIGLVCLFLHYFWQIVIMALIVFVATVIWMLLRDQQLRARELAVRAEEQNRQYLAGDPQGIFGDLHEGLEQR